MAERQKGNRLNTADKALFVLMAVAAGAVPIMLLFLVFVRVSGT